MNSIFIFRRDFRINDNTALIKSLKNSDIYVDALLGAGINQSPREPYKTIIKQLIDKKKKGKKKCFF